MPSLTQTSGSQATLVPPVRAFQFDSAVPDAANLVNLFRGTVALPLPLLSLPGLNGNDVTIQASYNGEAASSADTWNVTAPTGLLGLGWSIPFEFISAEGVGADTRYFLMGGASATELVCTDARDRTAIRFEPIDFKFWQVTYDATRELWTIVQEDGTTRIYGDASSGRSTVQYGVRWGAWREASTSAGQQRYVNAWNLSQIRSVWGDVVTFTFDAVEQAVGSGGQRYTKASYLSRIVDTFGRTVTFVYGEKVYDRAKGVCEYQDPHKTAPSNVPDAYQSRYQTRFLQQIAVAAADGAPLTSIDFGYEIRSFARLPVNDPDAPLYAKRLLVSVVQRDGAGNSLPGFAFDYGGAKDPLPGGLTSIVYPAGSIVTFSYRKDAILGTGRSLAVPAPAAGAVPRVWHGNDYVLVTWHDRAGGELLTTIYSWNGRWTGWSLATIRGQIDPASLVVIPRAAFAVIAFRNTATNRDEFHILRRDPRRFGDWTVHVDTVPLAAGAGATQLASGDEFFIAFNAAYAGPRFHGFGWSWRDQAWEALPSPTIAADPARTVTLGAVRNAFVACSFDPAAGTVTFQTVARDMAGRWSALAAWTTTNVRPYLIDDKPALTTTTGEVFLTLAFLKTVTSGAPGSADYEVRTWIWDEQFRVIDMASPYTYTASVDIWQGKPDMQPLEIGFTGSLLGNNRTVSRYRGPAAPAWSSQAFPAPSASGATYNFAYGDDVAAMSRAAGAALVNQLLAYDPNRNGWTTVALPAKGTRPTLSGDVATVGAAVWRRGVDGIWRPLATGLTAPVADASVANFAPNYIVYGDGAGALRVALFRGGRIAVDELVASGQTTAVASGGPGTQLTAPAAFVAYPAGKPFDQATTLWLYQVAGRSMTLPLTNTPVVTVRVQDGYAGDSPTAEAFSYDQSTCTFDATTALTQYGRVRRVSGSADSHVAPQGYTDFYYSNGFSNDASSYSIFGTPLNYMNVLNGVLLARLAYDTGGKEVSRTVNAFDVRTRARALSTGAWRNVAGAWFVAVAQLEIKDGVQSRTDAAYDDATGQQTESRIEFWNSDGHKVRKRTTYERAAARYPAMAARNMLNQIAAETSFSAVDGADEAIVAHRVTTWQAWDVDASGPWGKASVYDWRGGGDATIPAEAWNGAPPGADWLRLSAIQAVTARGQPRLMLDVGGRLSENLFAADGATPIASFVNAAATTSGAAYHGFEPYEASDQAWTCTPASSGAVTAGDSRAGTCCFAMTGAAVLSRVLPLPVPRKTYVLCGWIKTAPGDPDGAVSWSVTLAGAGGRITHPVAATAGSWAFRRWIFDLPGDGSATTATLALEVTGGSRWVRVDSLAFFPLDSTYSAAAVDMALRVPTAQLGPNGECATLFLDGFARQIGSAGPGEAPVALNASFATRQVNAVSPTVPFPQGQPNQIVEFQARAAGVVDRFADGDEGLWTFAGQAWRIAGRALVHAGASADPLGDTALRRGFASPDMALSVEVAIDPGGSAAVGNGDVFAAWSAVDGWRLLRSSKGVITVLAQAAAGPARRWLFAMIDGRALLFADGAPLFDIRVTPASPPPDGLVLAASGGVRFQRLIALADPTASFSFTDGGNKTRQRVRLLDGATGVRDATLYDALGRAAAETFAAYSTGPSAFAYDVGFVTNAGPGGALWNGAPLTGGLADAYPEAGGYPFRRSAFEASPLGRIVARGQAGVDFALRPDQPHVTRFEYRANTAADAPDLPPGQYRAEVRYDPNGVSTTTLVDLGGARVWARVGATVKGVEHGAAASFRYDAMGRMARAIPPARSVAPVDRAYDFLGRTVSLTSPDTGLVRSLPNDEGQIRFMSTAAGAAASPPFILYQKFDTLGRLIEKGYYPFVWDAAGEAELRAKADGDPAWPPATQTWRQRYWWDWDGGQDAPTIGRCWRTESHNSDTATADVIETRVHGLDGAPIATSLVCTGFGPQAQKVGYGHNLLGAVISTAAGDAEPPVLTGYDRLGRVTGVGVAGDATRFAAYAYDANGRMTEERLHPGASGLMRSYEHAPPGWPLRIADATTSETLTYTEGGYDGAGYWDGQVASQEVAYPPLGQYIKRTFRNDSQGRLTAIGGGAANAEVLAYDANGNMLSRSGGGGAVFTYESGTNRLRSTDGGQGDAYRYDPSGNVIEATSRSLSLEYDRGTGAVRKVLLGGGAQVAYAYGGGSRRVFKSAGSDRLYVHGSEALPLVEIERTGGAEVRSRLVYGPTGLIAVRVDGVLYFVAKDHLGSIRTITREDGTLVAAFDYDPFGETSSLSGDASAFRYRFTGQEVDLETGLYNFRLRLYDPALGRFYQVDPAGQQASPYIYVGDAPLLFVDRSGADFGLSLLIAIIIGAVVSAMVSAVTYAIVNRNDFHSRDFGIAIGAGALAGAIGGAVGFAGPAVLAAGATTIGAATVAQSAAFSITAGAAFGAGGGALGQLAANAVTGQDLGSGMLMASLTGFVGGGIGGYVGWRVNVGRQLGYHGTTSNYVNSIARQINPPPGGVSFEGAELGEGFYTSAERGTAEEFAFLARRNAGVARRNEAILRIFSRREPNIGQIPEELGWTPLPWARLPSHPSYDPLRAGYINNFDALAGVISDMEGQTQIKYNPRFYGQLKAFPEQATGIWRYLPGHG
ncbi:RHS repeat domain-containing protein [Sorangium sp. So ce362]|uniref:RHS repeat domain-containing protein n=1 Tax=Sorangium sp. So ce362 TaxID=3133303 RepID=UPI003F62DDEA